MKEANCFFPNALPDKGRRMTKGSGCSACFRGGVTYGYMGCLRKGRVRQKAATQVRRSLMLDGLAKSFYVQSVELERSSPFRRFTFKMLPCSLETFFRVVRARPYIEKYYRPFALNFRCAMADFLEKHPSPD
ncbi:hypothetical protein [Pseudomonas fluorescens]|nr:hypothetical protein [Pseudomonas fluorescens]